MPKPYSSDFRRLVIEEVVEGASRREAAERFGISASVVVIWMQRFNRTGAVAALPSGGSISPLEKHKKFLLGLAARKPDMTLDEIVTVMSRLQKTSGEQSRSFVIMHSEVKLILSRPFPLTWGRLMQPLWHDRPVRKQLLIVFVLIEIIAGAIASAVTIH